MSRSYTDPTLIAPEMQAGNERPFVTPPLPLDTTVAMPAAFNWSIAAAMPGRLLSQVEEKVTSDPRLMFTAAMSKLSFSA